jgi:hypothetical protein
VYKIIGADGKEYGPISLEVLRQWMAEGRANGETRVLPEGSTEWKTIAELPELKSVVATISAPPGSAPVPISLPARPRNNSYAVAGLTLGILSLTLGLCCCYGFPFSIPGVICSTLALNQFKQDPTQQGRGLAIAGLVLSILSIILGIGLVIFAVSFSGPDMWRRFRRL